MGLGTFLGRFLGRQDASASKSAAKDRLRLVLMHDRTDIPATMMEAIRTEMMTVLSKYVEIDNDAMDVQLEREAGSIGLVLNIPIRRVKTEAEASEALAVMHAVQATGSPLLAAAPIAEEPATDTAVATHEVVLSDEDDAEPSPDADVVELETPDDDNPEESASATDNSEKVEARKPAVVRVGASVPMRALGHTKATSELGTLEASPAVGDGSKPTAADDEPRPLVRDAWYSAELLHVVSTERQETSD